MARIYADRIGETTTTNGTNAFVLAGAVAGQSAFSSACEDQDTFDYAAFAVDNNGVPTGAWETGTGTFEAASDSIARTVQQSSNGNALVNFANGTKIVLMTVNSKTIMNFGGGGGGIPDAPADGNLYGRKNNAWAVIRPNAPMYRMRTTAATGGGYTSVAEITFVNPAENIPRGVASSGGDYSGDYNAAKAVDGNLATNWISSQGGGVGAWIGYTSTDSSVADPTAVKISASENGGEGNRVPTSFAIDACYDGQGVAWNTLWQVNGIPAFADGETRTVNKPN